MPEMPRRRGCGSASIGSEKEAGAFSLALQVAGIRGCVEWPALRQSMLSMAMKSMKMKINEALLNRISLHGRPRSIFGNAWCWMALEKRKDWGCRCVQCYTVNARPLRVDVLSIVWIT